jgi:hypothetical protein
MTIEKLKPTARLKIKPEVTHKFETINRPMSQWHTEVLTKLSRFPSSVENTFVTT